MTHLSDAELAELKTALENEKRRLESELAAHGKKNHEQNDWQGAMTDFEADEEESDPVDAADNIEELATNVSIVETLEARLKDVIVAMEKMEQGTYGTCEDGKGEIPLERLKANPAAKTCTVHG